MDNTQTDEGLVSSNQIAKRRPQKLHSITPQKRYERQEQGHRIYFYFEIAIFIEA